MHEVLDELGVRSDLLAPQQLSELDELGYCHFDGFLTADQIGAALGEIEALLRTGGALRLMGLLEAGKMFDPLWLRPTLLAAVRHLLGPEFRISDMRYQAGGGQALHMDTVERAEPGRWQVCNSIVALTAFTPENGATRVVPGSHLDYGFRPPTGHDDHHPDQALLLGPAGTGWLLNSHLWRSGTANRSRADRHAVLTGFHRRDGATTLLDRRPSDATIERLGSAAYLLM